jgi:hypothetical protein
MHEHRNSKHSDVKRTTPLSQKRSQARSQKGKAFLRKAPITKTSDQSKPSEMWAFILGN